MRLTLTAAAAFAALAASAYADGDGSAPTALAAAAEPIVADGASEWRTEPNFGLRKMLGFEPRCRDVFDDFARPVTNLSFHHPFIWNEIRPLFVQHWFPETSALDGGDLRAYALQIHVALSQDVQLTAWKDGYVDFDSGAFEDETGFADFALGVKVKVWEDVEAPAIFTAGLGYETTFAGATRCSRARATGSSTCSGRTPGGSVRCTSSRPWACGCRATTTRTCARCTGTSTPTSPWRPSSRSSPR